MRATRIIYNRGKGDNLLAICSVVLDDSLSLKNIELHQNEEGYYLIFPSKQDIYKKVSAVNKGVFVKYPKDYNTTTNSSEGNKSSDEFFHPVTRDFYVGLLDSIVEGYEHNKGKILKGFSNICYRFN